MQPMNTMKDNNYLTKLVQYCAIITWSIFSKILTIDTP